MILTPKDLSLFFHTRDQIHAWHLSTRSYPEHKALGDFYSGWLDLVDSLIEKDAGADRPGTPVNLPAFAPYATGGAEKFLTNNIVPFLERLNERFDGEPGLQNIVADMMNLTAETLYLLQLS